MRFCLASTQMHWGGGEELLFSLAEELRAAGHSLYWIVRANSEVESRLEPCGSLIVHRLRGRGSNITDCLAVRHLLRNLAPDVVLLNDTHAVPAIGFAAWCCRQPKPLRLAYKHTVFPLRSRLKYRLLTDKLICVSEAAKQVVVRGGLPAEHAVVIYGGVREPQIPAGSRDAVRRELGLSEHQRLLVCVGNLLDCKGHAELVSAISQIGDRCGELLAVIAGEGAERDKLERQITQLGLQNAVRLLGFRDDVPQLLAAADVVVHPSHAEGLSLVLIQSQLLCKPIVATAVGGAAEVMQSDDSSQCTSWIAEAKNATSLAQQIRAALAMQKSDPSGLQQRLEATAARTRRKFDIRSNALELVEVCAGYSGQCCRCSWGPTIRPATAWRYPSGSAAALANSVGVAPPASHRHRAWCWPTPQNVVLTHRGRLDPFQC